jgi:hypothetical protein
MTEANLELGRVLYQLREDVVELFAAASEDQRVVLVDLDAAFEVALCELGFDPLTGDPYE